MTEPTWEDVKAEIVKAKVLGATTSSGRPWDELLRAWLAGSGGMFPPASIPACLNYVRVRINIMLINQ